MQDNGLPAIVSRSDAPIFLRWLAFAIPLSLVDHMISAEGEVNHNTNEFVFKTKLIMLLGEIMKILNEKDRVALASCGRDERNKRISTCQYIDSIRQGRNFQSSQGPMEMSTYMSRDEFVRKSKNVVQEESPDVAYSRFEHSFQLDAYNRITICRKLLMLS